MLESLSSFEFLNMDIPFPMPLLLHRSDNTLQTCRECPGICLDKTASQCFGSKSVRWKSK